MGVRLLVGEQNKGRVKHQLGREGAGGAMSVGEQPREEGLL